MQIEVFKPLKEMTVEELVAEFIYCHQKHRPLKLSIRQSNEYLKRYQLGPGNIYGYMEELTNREVYGLRKMKIRDYLHATNPKVHRRPDGYVDWREYLKEEIDKINKPLHQSAYLDPYVVREPDSNGIVAKTTHHIFTHVKQAWEGLDMVELAALAGNAYVDIPSGWGSVKGEENAEPKPFTGLITYPQDIARAALEKQIDSTKKD